MTLFKRQVALLEPNLRKLVTQAGPRASRLTPITCRKQAVETLKIRLESGRTMFLHSKYDPFKEAKGFASTCGDKPRVFLAGFGLGYQVRALLEKMQPEQQLITVVLNFDVFQWALQHHDMTDFLVDQRLNIIAGRSLQEIAAGVNRYTRDIEPSHLEVVLHEASVHAMPCEYQPLQDIFQGLAMARRTSQYNDGLLKQNIQWNLPIMAGAAAMADLVAKPFPCPCFVVSAGPSLDRNISDLMLLKGRGLIACAGSALAPLVNAGIQPDLVVVTDPLPNVALQLEPFQALQLPLLFIPGVNAAALALWTGPKILALPNQDPLFDQMETILRVGTIPYGGTVASAALALAIALKADPIVWVGQDFALSHSGQRGHATGVLSATPTEKLLGAPKTQVTGYFGNQMETLKNLYQYLRWTERLISRHPHLNFINATEGGAHIEGGNNLKLRHAIYTYCRTPNVSRHFQQHLANLPFPAEKDRDKRLDMLQKVAL